MEPNRTFATLYHKYMLNFTLDKDFFIFLKL